MKLTARLALLLLLCAGLRPAAAQVRCDPRSFGDLLADPLTITGAFDLPAGCTLDFGDREVILQGILRGVDLTILAGDLTVGRRGSIQGGEGTTTLILSRIRQHSGSAQIDGMVVSNGQHGGGVDIDAAGDVIVSATGQIEAAATELAGYGGFIGIAAGGAIDIGDGAVLAAAGGELAEFPGLVDLRSTAGDITVTRAVRVSGGSLGGRGTIDMSAGAALTVAGDLLAAGACGGDTCQPAGQVRLAAGADLTLKGTVDAAGAGASPFAGETEGGEVTLDAGGSIYLAGERLRLHAGAGGTGGALRARCGGDYRQDSAVQANGGAETGNGGTIAIVCDGSAAIGGAVDASGGAAGLGGSFRLEAGADARILNALDVSGNYPQEGCEIVALGGSVAIAVLIDASGPGDFGTGAPVSLLANNTVELDGARILAAGAGANGLGGSILLDAFQSVILAGRTLVDASGDPEGRSLGEGGTVAAVACEILVARESTVRAAGGSGGSIFMTASNGMAVLGSLEAETGGLIELRSAPGLVPDLSGASLSPRPVSVEAASVAECLVPPPCDPVTDLRCVADATSVTLTWQRAAGHTATQVLRNGEVLARLAAGAERYVDSRPPDGAHSYTVVGSCFGDAAPGTRCNVQFPGGSTFRRGDCNSSRAADISDAIFVLGFLFQGTQERLFCADACDFNDDGTNDISDAIALLTFLFVDATRRLPPPLEECGADPTADTLLCESFDACP